MIGKALQMYAEDLGFTVNDDCAYGIYEGYLLTLYDNINKKTCFVNYYLEEDNELDAQKKFDLNEFIKDNIESLKIDDYEIDVNGMFFSTKEGLIKLSELIKTILDKLKELQFLGADTCSECGKHIDDGKIKKVSVELNRYGLCDDCTIAFLEATKNEKSSNSSDEITDANDKNDYNNKSWISTLIIALVGLIAWPIITLWVGSGESFDLFICALMAFLLPIIHVRLYDMFGGKQNEKRLIIITVSIVLISIIANYIISVGNAYSSFGITDFDMIIKSLKYALVEPFEISENILKTSFYKNSIISILVALIGIVLFISDLLKPKAQSTKNISID